MNLFQTIPLSSDNRPVDEGMEHLGIESVKASNIENLVARVAVILMVQRDWYTFRNQLLAWFSPAPAPTHALVIDLPFNDCISYSDSENTPRLNN
jgi:hypothetical protein